MSRNNIARIGCGFFIATLMCANGATVADAIKRGDVVAARALVDQKADVNAAGPDGTTALHWAVENDDQSSVELLIKAGANVKAKDRYGLTGLYYATTNGNTQIVQRLLEAGADGADVGPAGDTALMAAARTGDVVTLRNLLKHGAVVNAKDTLSQETALMWAVRSDHYSAVQLLLESGATIDAVTVVGRTPPMRPPGAGGASHGLGISRGGIPERGAREATPGGMTALLYAARDGRAEIAGLLLGAHADPNLARPDNISPLLVAITNNHPDVARLLIERGADPKAMDWFGRTPLWAAVDIRNCDQKPSGELEVDRDGALSVIRLLLDRGVDVNARTKEVVPTRRFIANFGDLSWVDFTGQTPFVRAALSGDVTVMRMLLAKGADPNLPTLAGTTALMAAAGVNWVFAQTYTESKESLLEAVRLCLENGADVNSRNSMGVTALIGAANRGSDDILQFLVEKGAKLDVKDNEGRSALTFAGGVFLATHAPVAKPSTIALIEKLGGKAQ